MPLEKSVCTIAAIAVSVTATAAARGDCPAKPLPPAGTPSQDVGQLVASWDKRDSPGCVVGVIHNGKLVYERAFGMANLDHDIPISTKSVFPIASLAKQFTAACVLLLAQEGALSLDDDIRRFLPEMPDYGQRITIRHLLHHTSGIRDYSNELLHLTGIWWDDALSDDDLVELLARQKGLNFMPGDEHRYSNSGYRLLAVIVKRVTGKSLRAYADEHVFRPLGMEHTHFHDDAGRIVKNRVAGYALTGDGKLEARANKTEFVGDSGVMTTVGDFLLWDQNLYRDQLGKPGFLDQLLAPGMLNDGKTVPYALGLNLGEYRGLKTVWHAGSAYSGFRSMYLRFPERQFSVVVFANSTRPKGFNAYPLAYQAADLYLADSLRPVPPPTPPSAEPTVQLTKQDLEGKQGTFLDPDGAPWVLTAKDGSLLVTVGVFSPPTYRTEALSPMRFRSADKSFPFEIEFQGGGADSPL